MASLNEVFFSVQGEGTFAGAPTLFVRFFGCNLDCSWCDQPSALTTRSRSVHYDLDSAELCDIVCAYPLPVHVCFTGGEPSFQHTELVEIVREIRERDMLNQEGRKQRRLLTMETNGTIFIKEFAEEPQTFLSLSPKFTGNLLNQRAESHGTPDILKWLRSEVRMHLKFVIENPQHFESVLKWLEFTVPEERRSEIPVYFQPEWYQREKFKDVLKQWVTLERYPEIAKLGFREIRFVTQQHKDLKVR